MAYIKRNEKGMIETYLLLDNGEEGWEEIADDSPELKRFLSGGSDPKEKKIEELKAMRDLKESAGFLFKGKVLDSDATSVSRLYGLINSIHGAEKLGVELPVQYWTCQDNSKLLIKNGDADLLSLALAEHFATQHRIYNQLKVEVEAAKTEAELQAIQWPEK